jgi:outer membrane biosynthesis protein TonB
MRPLARLGFAMVLAAAAALVTGCDTLEDVGSLLDHKTKLPGERKPVFPEGVPGVTPGVPPEMVKGYREPVVETPPPPVLGEQTQAAEAKPKPKPKPHAIQAAAKPQPAPVAQATAPAPAGATPWPSQPQQQQPQQQPQAAWPSAPASGTISR